MRKKKNIPEKFVDYVAQAYYSMKLMDKDSKSRKMYVDRWLTSLDIAKILNYDEEELTRLYNDRVEEIEYEAHVKCYDEMKKQVPYMMEGKSLEDFIEEMEW